MLIPAAVVAESEYKDYILAELSIKWLKLAHRLFNTVLTFVVSTIDETAPHHDTLIRLQCIC